jgi:hypothetical protein
VNFPVFIIIIFFSFSFPIEKEVLKVFIYYEVRPTYRIHQSCQRWEQRLTL